jgi:5-(carboxyamino)imidazole ribonucleotide mutase
MDAHRLDPRIDARRAVRHAATMNAAPVIGIIMGSTSDWPTMEHAARILRDFGVAWEAEVVSAHRTPGKLVSYAESARGRGLKCIIAGAGGAAHLPGMTAAITDLPVLGVPVESKALQGVDSLLSIVQMPGGIPTATFAIGKPGAINAALFAVAMLANNDEELAGKLAAFRKNQTATVLGAALPSLDPID